MTDTAEEWAGPSEVSDAHRRFPLRQNPVQRCCGRSHALMTTMLLWKAAEGYYRSGNLLELYPLS